MDFQVLMSLKAMTKVVVITKVGTLVITITF